MVAAAAAVVVTAAGRVGPLQMGRSTRSDVVSFFGEPNAERRGRYPAAVAWRALGYGCERPVRSVFGSCRTVFWLNARTGRLADFYTASPRFVERHGVRIGMKTAAAERRLRTRAYGGCTDGIRLRPNMTIPIDGGRDRRVSGGALHVVGGHVAGFVLHGPDDVGIFDCW